MKITEVPTAYELELKVKRLNMELNTIMADNAAMTNEVLELRAQIAATLRQSLQHRDTLRAELAEARAQIAAKDAALREVLKGVLYVHGRGGLGLDVHGILDGCVGVLNAALAEPARETE